jgi:hypothetical protein
MTGRYLEDFEAGQTFRSTRVWPPFSRNLRKPSSPDTLPNQLMQE